MVFDCPSSAGSVRYGYCQHEMVSSAAPRPVTAQHLTIFPVGEAIRQPFTGRAAIDILRSNIDEVLLAKTAGGFGT
jgi:hypothetical protein